MRGRNGLASCPDIRRDMSLVGQERGRKSQPCGAISESQVLLRMSNRLVALKPPDSGSRGSRLLT